MSASSQPARERGSTHTAAGCRAGRLDIVVDERADTQPQAAVAEQSAAGLPAEPDRAGTPVQGPLLAVCGLCGGAGASTLAYLVARAAARAGPGPVLVADTGGPSGGLSCYAGVAAPRSLEEAAEHVASGLPAGRLVATTGDGLRVLATEPEFTLECAREGVELLLDHARERYALTVIDCGTLAREADQIALAKASHAAWVLPATDSGVRRAGRVLEAVTPRLPARELIVARHDERAPKAAVRELRRLAELRAATLVFLPTLPDLATGQLDRALDLAQVSLQAIAGVLGR
jgi:Flp pilus assembly CpaE family ATPase